MPTGIYKRTEKTIASLIASLIKNNKEHPYWLGKKRPSFPSEKTRKKIREANKGEKNYFYGKHFLGDMSPNWKGGISKLRDKIKNTFQYRQWRSDVFTRDNFTCQKCGEKSGNGKAIYLEAHHIKPFAEIREKYQIKTLEEALHCEELWNINNGQTLCLKCHNKTKLGGAS